MYILWYGKVDKRYSGDTGDQTALNEAQKMANFSVVTEISWFCSTIFYLYQQLLDSFCEQINLGECVINSSELSLNKTVMFYSL